MTFDVGFVPSLALIIFNVILYLFLKKRFSNLTNTASLGAENFLKLTEVEKKGLLEKKFVVKREKIRRQYLIYMFLIALIAALLGFFVTGFSVSPFRFH